MTWLRSSLLVLSLTALTACDRFVPCCAPPDPAPQTGPSAQSEALRVYYAQVQADLLARGLLRTDGGGPDTPYTPDMLARNFERVAFYDEYARGAGLRKSSGRAGQLRRWTKPVRISVEYGAHVPDTVRTRDTATVTDYAARLARITGHPISVTPDAAKATANFHVLVMTKDDTDHMAERIAEIVPGVGPQTLDLFRNTPRSIHCLVVAFSSEENDNDYRTAIAYVRAEHPDLLRKSCYHEEIAQGLGLANDSPDARPSIFNDDDEFALLTTHDEALLKMLYDPRLHIGMTLEQARPVIKILARDQTGRIY